MTARLHHYVPQCYLKRFTDTGRKDGRLIVYDGENKRSFETKPRNVAAKRDFNRIDSEVLKPDYVEGEYAILESHFDTAIEQILTAGNFDSTESRKYMFAFIAQLITRNPRMRARFNEFRSSVLKRVMNIVLSSKETYESQIRKATKAGFFNEEPTIPYEKMKQFEADGQYKILFSRMSHIEQELKLMEEFQGLIAERDWCLLIASNPRDGFITCDHPAVLMSKRRERSVYGPGLGVRQTELYLPLSPICALLGSFEPLPRVGQADIFQTAWRNAQIISFARPQVFSSDRNFSYMWPGLFNPFLGDNDLLSDPNFVNKPSSRNDAELF